MATKRQNQLGVGVLVVVFVVAGGLVWRSCERSGAGARQALAQAYDDVQPARLGTVVYDESNGSGRFSDDLPTRSVGVVFSTLDQDAVRSKIDTRLKAEGFRLDPGRFATTWERRKEGHLAIVYRSYVLPGDPIAGPHSKVVQAGSTGVLLRFLGAG